MRVGLYTALLASLAAAAAHAQSSPGFVDLSPVPPSPNARGIRAGDLNNAFGTKANTANGVLTTPTVMGSDATNPAISPVGPDGLPNVYGPNHIVLPNNSLQINLGHPYGSRGLAVGENIWIGGGASPTNINTGSPPVGPTVDTWESNPTTASSYDGIDSVGLVVANTAEANHETVTGVTILSTAPDVVNAPAGQVFTALACRRGEIVALNTTPVLWGAVTGCPTTSQMTVQGWEVPGGASLSPANTAPNQNPTNTTLYTQPTTLTLTALAPTHVFDWNSLTFVGAAGTAATQGTGWEEDMVCQASTTCVNSDGADLFSASGEAWTGVNVDGSLTGGWNVGLHVSHAHYAGVQVDLSDETPASSAVTGILIDKAYGHYVIARTAGVPTWGEDNEGNSTHSCPTGVSAGCGTGTFGGVVSTTGLHEIATTLDAYPILLQQGGVNLLQVDGSGDANFKGALVAGGNISGSAISAAGIVAGTGLHVTGVTPDASPILVQTAAGTNLYLIDNAGDTHNAGATLTDGITTTAGVKLTSTTFAGLGSCTSAGMGTLKWITDAGTVTYRGAAIGGGSTPALVACNGTAWEYH